MRKQKLILWPQNTTVATTFNLDELTRLNQKISIQLISHRPKTVCLLSRWRADRYVTKLQATM